MSRKSQKVRAKRENKKDEIARAAMELFQDQGYERVTLQDIAKKIQRSRTTLYEYFQDKGEILAFHLIREMFLYRDKVMGILAESGTFQAKMKRFIGIQLAYGASHAGFSQLLRSLERDATRIAARTRTEIIKLHGEVYGALTKEIQAAIDRSEIRDVHPGIFMQLLINATSLPIRGGKDPETLAAEILDVLWKGIGRT